MNDRWYMSANLRAHVKYEQVVPSICKMHESNSLEIFITNYLSHVITFHEDYLGFTVMFDFDRHFGGGFLCIKVTPELG